MTRLVLASHLLALTCPALLFAETTFNEHIAPLIHENCTGCHRPDQSGPFSLITYRDVKKRSGTIEDVLLDRYMPPWKPVNTNVHFANNRRLSQKQIDLFSKWVEAGCPEGDPNHKPVPPDYPSGWYLGEPDLVVTMNGKFEVPASGPDIYRSFVFPLRLSEDKWVKAVELRPKAKSAVHHALFFIDTTGQARAEDARDGKAGMSGMGFLRGQRQAGVDPASAAFNGSGGLGGHVPGATPAKLPGDLAMFLPKNSDVVMQTHFHPSGKKEVEQAELALYFTDREPEKRLVPIQIPPAFGALKLIDIAAGEKNYIVEDSFLVPVPVEAVVVGGHAHYLCREMKMTATLPGGKEMALLDIPDWDLDWQDRYQFERPIDLPAGTVLRTRLRYDNSANNPENPFNPPQRVRWGPQSTDEMGSITLIVVPKDKDHADALNTALARKMRDARGDTGEILRKRVTNVANYDNNGDGVIQYEEVPRWVRSRIFNQFDKDKNRVLDESEQPALQKHLNSWARPRRRPQPRKN